MEHILDILLWTRLQLLSQDFRCLQSIQTWVLTDDLLWLWNFPMYPPIGDCTDQRGRMGGASSPEEYERLPTGLETWVDIGKESNTA